MTKIAPVLLLLLAGCASLPPLPPKPREQVTVRFVNPTCLFFCYTRITVSNAEGEAAQEHPPAASPPD